MPLAAQSGLFPQVSRCSLASLYMNIYHTWCFFFAICFPSRQRGVAREAPQTGRAHGDDNPQVAPSVRKQEDQDGRSLARRERIPQWERRRLVRSKSVEGGLFEFGLSMSASIHMVDADRTGPDRTKDESQRPKQPKHKPTREKGFSDAIVDAS